MLMHEDVFAVDQRASEQDSLAAGGYHIVIKSSEDMHAFACLGFVVLQIHVALP